MSPSATIGATIDQKSTIAPARAPTLSNATDVQVHRRVRKRPARMTAAPPNRRTSEKARSLPSPSVTSAAAPTIAAAAYPMLSTTASAFAAT
jgi:hypothetical protein